MAAPERMDADIRRRGGGLVRYVMAAALVRGADSGAAVYVVNDMAAARPAGPAPTTTTS